MSIPYVADSPDHSLLKFQDQNHNHATNSRQKRLVPWKYMRHCSIPTFLIQFLGKE